MLENFEENKTQTVLKIFPCGRLQKMLCMCCAFLPFSNQLLNAKI